jgi:hypothetical protein
MWKKCEQEFAMPRGPFLDAFAKLQQLTISFIMSVHFRGTTQIPLSGFFLNLIFIFQKCQEN